MQKAFFSFFTNPKKIRTWYVCAFLLLVFSLALTHYVTRKLLEQSQEVAVTDATINNLELTLSYTKDAETAIRGFIIMKNPAFLQPLKGSRQKTDSIYNVLTQQLADSEAQEHNLTRLQRLVNSRFQHILLALDTFKRYQQQTDIFYKKNMTAGKIIMDSLRRHVSNMQQYERTVLAQRQERMDTIYRIVTAVNIASLIMSILLATFAIYTYSKENRARQEADEKTADYRQRLEARVAELRAANAELSTLRNNEKFSSTGRIARTIAHEVRNPLTNINLAMEYLKEEFADAPETHNMLDIINRNSQRIQHLIADLLNSTRFSELKFELLSVNDLINQALQQAQDRLNFQHIEVVKQYQPNLPPIMLDGEKLKLAFLNIVVNAIEAMPPENGVLTIKTFADVANCNITITDNGCGMNQETIQRLFEPYFTQKPKGTGLGMTNTQNVILNHKGVLEVESDENCGTTFTIRLPFTIN